jgi:hypothetical protein
VRYYPELPAGRTQAITGDLVVVALLRFPLGSASRSATPSTTVASLGRGVEQAGDSVKGGVEDAARLLGWVTSLCPPSPSALSSARASRARAPAVRRRASTGRCTAFGLPYEALVSDTPDPLGALAGDDYEPLLAARAACARPTRLRERAGRKAVRIEAHSV